MHFSFPLRGPCRLIRAHGWPERADFGCWRREGLDLRCHGMGFGLAFQSPLAPGIYRISSPYGYRIAPAGQKKGTSAFHNGLDMAAPQGTPIHAAAAGTVKRRYYADQPSGRLNGNAVILGHDEGFQTAYLHMSRVDVSPGQQVAAGQQIGLVGATGQATGPHLHFMVYQGTSPVDPARFISVGGAPTAPASAGQDAVAAPGPGPQAGTSWKTWIGGTAAVALGAVLLGVVWRHLSHRRALSVRPALTMAPAAAQNPYRRARRRTRRGRRRRAA